MAWGPKVPDGFSKLGRAKERTIKNTISDLRNYQREGYKDEDLAGVNIGPNSEAVRRANSTMRRYNDYSKTATRLTNTDLRKERSAAYRAAQSSNQKSEKKTTASSKDSRKSAKAEAVKSYKTAAKTRMKNGKMQ
jgi:regulator of protease activity HflC (stomatin/prohibitin superfamily)